MMGLRYETEKFIRCCDETPLSACCLCNGPEKEKLMPTIWKITDAPHFTNSWLTYYDIDGTPHELVGWKFAWGCEKFDNERVRYIELHDTISYPGPILPGNPLSYCLWQSPYPEMGKCCELGCPKADGATVGHGGPEIYRPSISCYMMCFVYGAVAPIEPLYQWHLDCGCDDLWVGDISEWGSLDDCLEYDTNCHCSNDEGSWSGDESGCNSIKAYYESLGIACGECEYKMVPGYEGSPGHPAFADISAGFSGSCACSRAYKFLDYNNYACRTMLEQLGISGSDDLPEWNCNGPNTLFLYQYMPEGETNPDCLGCIKDGADSPCQCSGSEFGLALHGYGCCGQPATITVEPVNDATEMDRGSDASDCNPDILCCNTELEGLAVEEAPTIPDNSIYWSIRTTSSNGYLKQNDEGLYVGGLPPLKFVVNKEERTINGKKMTMLSEDIFWGFARFGDKYFIEIEVME